MDYVISKVLFLETESGLSGVQQQNKGAVGVKKKNINDLPSENTLLLFSALPWVARLSPISTLGAKFIFDGVLEEEEEDEGTLVIELFK